MPNIKAAWFLPRTRDHPPPSALRLGDVIASPFNPEEVVNGDPPPPAPRDLLRTFEQQDWSWKKEFEKSHSGGVFASFLDVVGIGPEVELGRDKARSDIYNAERLVTEYFIPNRQYMNEVLKDPDVKDELTGPNRRSKLFMITGLKVAYGATRALELMNGHVFNAKVSVNLGTLGGTPIPGAPSVGPKADMSSSTTEKMSGGRLDFVFGIQLRQLRYKKGQVDHQKYDKGALYGGTQHEELVDDHGEDVAVDLADLEVEEPALDDLDGIDMRTIDAAGDDGDEGDVQVVFANTAH